MAPRRRLDAELVRRGLAPSRAAAQALIEQGGVVVRGAPAGKATTMVDPADALEVVAGGPAWASRGAHKLVGALDAFHLDVVGRRCLDAGASTGGFTDVLLQRGAAHVTAVDVGYGQLAWRLRSDQRVEVRDRTNVRHLAPGDIDPPRDLVVADLSLICLTGVLPALRAVAADDADLLPMVKPQFEVGPDRVGSGGVVRDPIAWADALRGVVDVAAGLGLVLRGAVPSKLPGPAGNVEFFLHLSASLPHPKHVPALLIAAAVAAGEALRPPGEPGPRRG